jgi:hypothetical protein
MDLSASGMGCIDGGGGGTDIDKRQPSCIAVRQDTHAVLNQLETVFSERFAVGGILVGKFFGRNERELLLCGDSHAGSHGGPDVVHGVDGIDGGGAGLGKGREDFVDVMMEFGAIITGEGTGPLGEPESGGGADGPSTANHHIANGGGGLTVILGGDDLKLVRQEPLLDELHLVGSRVESDSAKMSFPTA